MHSNMLQAISFQHASVIDLLAVEFDDPTEKLVKLVQLVEHSFSVLAKTSFNY